MLIGVVWWWVLFENCNTGFIYFTERFSFLLLGYYSDMEIFILKNCTTLSIFVGKIVSPIIHVEHVFSGWS